MQVKTRYSEALTNNIERTYTYAHAKNVYQYSGNPTDYNPVAFFNELIERDPFGAFMELDNYGFKNALNALDR